MDQTNIKGLTIFVLSILFLVIFTLFFAKAYNYEYVNVTSRVNVTDSIPEIMAMSITDPVVLSAGSNEDVFCNATIRNWKGYNDIASVNATFYFEDNSTSPDHNNVHYTNSSCVEINNDGGFFANYSCSFPVSYYADSGNWSCNMSVNSTVGLNSFDIINTTVESMYALNVTNIIDYGNLTVTETSLDVPINITNFGNSDINVSVLGYGLTEGDGLGLVCEHGSNITIEHQRFSNALEIYDDKTPLADIDQDMSFTLIRPKQETIPVIQTTYWQLYVPPNPFGLCTGTVRFTATAT